MADNLKATSESMIRQSRAIRKLAADNNVSLDDEDQKPLTSASPPTRRAPAVRRATRKRSPVCT